MSSKLLIDLLKSMSNFKIYKPNDPKPQKYRKGIYKAIKHNDINLVKKFISSGIDLNKRDNYGDTPLELAVELGYTKIVKELLEAGACSDMVCGIKLLQISCRLNYIGIAKMLIKIGVDVNLKLEEESTLLIDAAGEGNLELIKLLVESGAEIDVIDRYKNSPLGLAVRNGHQEVINYFRKIGCFEESELLYLLSD